MKAHALEAVLRLCGITVNANLESGGRMKKGSPVHFYCAIDIVIKNHLSSLSRVFTLFSSKGSHFVTKTLQGGQKATQAVWFYYNSMS